jgi:nucleoside 2-deoxyribosyltransferase
MLLPQPEKIYLASPFFNAEQLAQVISIERLLQENGYSFFSPRTLGKKPPISPQDAAYIFQKDTEELDASDVVLANLDYLLPELQCLAVCTEGSWDGRGLRLPDTGVVFECGYAYRSGTPIVAFVSEAWDSPLNVMMAQCCCAICVGLSDLGKVFSKEGYQPDHATLQWNGGLQ